MASQEESCTNLVQKSPRKNQLKRNNDDENRASKRPKTDNIEENTRPEVVDVQKLRRKNFVAACEMVSYKAYFDRRSRLQLSFIPNRTIKRHHEKDSEIQKKIPSYAEESFKIEMKSNMWTEALEVCYLTITPEQYLSPNVLQGVVEIMMNAQNDENSDNTLDEILDKCQHILSLHFTMHPPVTKSLSKCYNTFLTSSMDLRQNTFTNRAEFEYDKGIVKYCFNRLEYEISLESIDDPLVDKLKNIPEEMKQSVQGLHWQKEKFEIFELLDRKERIKRLMMVLESIVELLKFDFAIWLTRYHSDAVRQITRPSRPLIAVILWPNVPCYTGALNRNCKQILSLFVHFVHLQYPEQYITIMMSWLNVIIEAFYICETNPNSDYPNTGLYCSSFANKFYDKISEMPPDSIIKILVRIHPKYMRHLIGVIHIRKMLNTKLDNILEIIKEFVQHSEWTQFPESNSTLIQNSKIATIKPKKVKRVTNYLKSKCLVKDTQCLSETVAHNMFLKFDPKSSENFSEIEPDLNHVIHCLYLTSEAFLDTYSLHNFRETLRDFNSKNVVQKPVFENSSYFVSHKYIKKYKLMCEMLTEVTNLLTERKCAGHLPELINIFENIGLIDS